MDQYDFPYYFSFPWNKRECHLLIVQDSIFDQCCFFKENLRTAMSWSGERQGIKAWKSTWMGVTLQAYTRGREKSLPPGSETNNNPTGTPSLSDKSPSTPKLPCGGECHPFPFPPRSCTVITEAQLSEDKLQAADSTRDSAKARLRRDN